MTTETTEPSVDHQISAYAKLEFDHFCFYIQTLALTVGRKAKRDDNVDVHLGMSKSISRQHARIYYQFIATTWEIEVLGKNGAFVNDRYIEAGGTCALSSTDRLQIADALFTFLLPEGSAAPVNPSAFSDPFPFDNTGSVTLNTIAPGQILRGDGLKIDSLSSPTPLAPHHLMQTGLFQAGEVKSEPVSLSQLELPSSDIESQTKSKKNSNASGKDESGALGPTGKKPRKKYTKKSKLSDSKLDEDITMDNKERSIEGDIDSPSPEELRADLPESDSSRAPEDSEVKISDEELAAQQAAQLLHQERLARQAQEEEEGLILPPPETDPAIIASFQKPPASYATMIYNAITSHEKKKMTLAQIYSWICINHPYYRYIQNGWQNSIRHNLSLNKAFKKVPRTDDEPGKGAFWAVDPDSEMLFEGGIYKKKPPRPPPATLPVRGSPVVMKAGKLALNPNYFSGAIDGKADEVFGALKDILARQLGRSCPTDQAVQLVRVLALALAAQLKTATLDAASMRQLVQQHAQASSRAALASSHPGGPQSSQLTTQARPINMPATINSSQTLLSAGLNASRPAVGQGLPSTIPAAKPTVNGSSNPQAAALQRPAVATTNPATARPGPVATTPMPSNQPAVVNKTPVSLPSRPPAQALPKPGTATGTAISSTAVTNTTASVVTSVKRPAGPYDMPEQNNGQAKFPRPEPAIPPKLTASASTSTT